MDVRFDGGLVVVRATKECVTCGAAFERHPKHDQKQWKAARYCSRECQGLATAKRLRRELPLCECGCGQRVKRHQRRSLAGHIPQIPPRRPIAKVLHFDSSTGRWYVRDRRGRKVYWARIVLADKLGRWLRPGELAHHIDSDPTNDSPENVELKPSHAAHMREHWQQWKAQGGVTIGAIAIPANDGGRGAGQWVCKG